MSDRPVRPDSSRQDPPRADIGRGEPRRPVRVTLPLLDRLIDDAPDELREATMTVGDTMEALRASVRRDLEALLNARRRWRSWPGGLRQLDVSPLGYGIPDFTSGAFADPLRREQLRQEIERTIRRFEPRLASVRVTMTNAVHELDTTLRMRIDGMMHASPAPEPIAFDTIVDAATADVTVRPTAAA